VGPTHQKQLFLGYQTLINVAAGEPRPQPRSQTATKPDSRLISVKLVSYHGLDKLNRANKKIRKKRQINILFKN